MASAEFTINVRSIPEVRRLVDACVELLKAEDAGADAYEVGNEVAAIRGALEGMGLRFPDRHRGLEPWKVYEPGR